MYKLYLDDIREPKQSYRHMQDTIYLQTDWVVVRTYQEFCDVPRERGLPLLVSFDHDLGDKAYASVGMSAEDMKNLGEKTGYDCAKFLCEYCMDSSQPLPPYLVHSWNPVGADNIRKYLESFNGN